MVDHVQGNGSWPNGVKPMRKRSTQTNEGALARFIARKAKIDALLTRLRDASDNHFNAMPGEVHWGHVGSLGHAAEKLREIAAFLNV